MATVTDPGSFMATITHPTGNGYCRDRILRDRTGSGYISTCHIKDPLAVFTPPLHIIIAMSYNASLTVFGHSLHNITVVSYNGPPYILSLQCHIMDPSTVIGPPYIISLQCHIMDPPDRLWTPPYILSLQCHIMDPPDRFWTPLTNYHCSVI